MSKSEKRYFKVLSSRHTIGEVNNYTLLFDFIEQQKEYNEEEIFKYFKNEAFLNKFSITKKRLYDNVINALDNYHSSNSIDAQIYKLLHSSDILHEKSLYNQSLKQLKSASKLASKNNKFNLLAEVNLKIKRVYESTGKLEEEEIEKMLQEDIYFLQQSTSFNKFWNLKSKLFLLLSSKGVSRTEEDLVAFKLIIDELLLAEDLSNLHYDSQYLYYHIYSAFYFATNSYEKCYEHLIQNLQLLENTSDLMKEHVNRYLSVLSNAIYVTFRLEKRIELKELQSKLKKLTSDEQFKNNEDFQIKLFSTYYSVELTLLFQKGELSEAQKLIPQIENGLALYSGKITNSRKAFLHFKIATILFSSGDFHASLKWLNPILNESGIEKQEDIVSMAHLLSLLIHFEMKNDDFIPYVLRNTQRYLKSRNRLYDFEKNFLKFITKMAKQTDQFDREELWKELYLDLSNQEDQSLKRIAFEYFDFITWAEAKSKRKEFQSLMKEKIRA
jgi:hypothetical protein